MHEIKETDIARLPESEKPVWKKLGEVAAYVKERTEAAELTAENYVGVDNLLQNRGGKTVSDHVPDSGYVTAFRSGDILLGNIRPYLKKIWKADCSGGASGDVPVLRVTDDELLPDYLYQVLADDRFFAYAMQYAKGAKMPRGDKAKLLDYEVPIYSLHVQRHIVEILGRFDRITGDFADGLPREIALRRRQYEYYRDALLDFPRS